MVAIDPEFIDDDFSALNWMRWLPDSAPFLYAVINYVGECGFVGDLDEFKDREVVAALETIGGLNGSAFWSGDHSFEISARDAAASVADLSQRKRYIGRAARAVGLKVIRSNRQAIELMRRLKMLERIEGDDERIQWHAVHPLPLPSERIPMTDAERDEEDRARWRAMHGNLGRQLVQTLADRASGNDQVTLAALSDQLHADPEDIRHALLVMIEEKAIFASRMIEGVDIDEVFELRTSTNSHRHDTR